VRAGRSKLVAGRAGVSARGFPFPAGLRASAQGPVPGRLQPGPGQGGGLHGNARRPGSQGGLGKPPKSFVSQNPLYAGVMPVAGSLTKASLDTYYKDTDFGQTPGGIASTVTPPGDPGATIYRDGRYQMAHIYADNRPDLMYAAGYDQAAARWIPAIGKMDSQNGDRCWAMMALAAPGISDVGTSRINAFIGRDISRDRVRSALLVAGLVGLGRIDAKTANSLNQRYGLGLGHQSSWTRAIDEAAARGEAGTVLVLMGTGVQTGDIRQLPAAHLYHGIAGLRRTWQDFTARMIAAEALSRA